MTAKLTTLERHSWLLLRAYPASYRRQRADEMLGTLLDTTPPGRTWPMPRDVIALLLGGLRARSGQDQRFSTPAGLRMAALLGCAVYLSFTAVNYASYGFVLVPHRAAPPVWVVRSPAFLWPPFIVALLILAAALLPWLASRTVVALGAIAAGTAIVTFLPSSSSGPLMPGTSSSPVRQILEVLGPLAVLVILCNGQQRPPRLWLWLPGLVTALAVPITVVDQLINRPLMPTPDPYLWLVPLAVVVAWIGIDARPAVALAVYSGLWFSQYFLNFWQFHAWNIYFLWQGQYGTDAWYASSWADSRMWIASVLALTVLALWRVRRQAVL
jgi:hypothetical protein